MFELKGSRGVRRIIAIIDLRCQGDRKIKELHREGSLRSLRSQGKRPRQTWKNCVRQKGNVSAETTVLPTPNAQHSHSTLLPSLPTNKGMLATSGHHRNHLDRIIYCGFLAHQDEFTKILQRLYLLEDHRKIHLVRGKSSMCTILRLGQIRNSVLR